MTDIIKSSRRETRENGTPAKKGKENASRRISSLKKQTFKPFTRRQRIWSAEEEGRRCSRKALQLCSTGCPKRSCDHMDEHLQFSVHTHTHTTLSTVLNTRLQNKIKKLNGVTIRSARTPFICLRVNNVKIIHHQPPPINSPAINEQ